MLTRGVCWIVSQAEPDVTLGGIFYFHSLSQVGTLLVNHGQVSDCER